MTLVVVMMLVVLAVAGLALAYAAFPHRGERLPGVPWLGDAVEKAADSVPTLDDGEHDRGLGLFREQRETSR